MSVDVGKLREALRPVFDKFDVDGSGAVSTEEMSAMVKQLKMDITPEKLRKMMVEADPDMSGEIDFEEFVQVTKAQIEAGNGGALAAVVQQAGGFFGFFGNIFSMFGGEAPAPAPAPPPAAAPKASGSARAPPSAANSPPAVVEAAPKAAGSAFFSAAPVEEMSMGVSGAGAGGSLFDQYMSPAEARANRKLGHGETRTTRLRATGVKLSVYLNTEVNKGYATVISLRGLRHAG